MKTAKRRTPIGQMRHRLQLAERLLEVAERLDHTTDLDLVEWEVEQALGAIRSLRQALAQTAGVPVSESEVAKEL